MVLDVVLLVGGLVVLSVAADRFVDGAARLALALRVAPIVVGAIVIGAGTSAPELLVTVLAAVEGAGGIALGNLVGSNIANLGLVLGVAALLTPLVAARGTLRREVPLSLAAVLVFAVVAADGDIGVPGGVLLLTLGVAAGVLIVLFARADQRAAAVAPAGRRASRWRPALLALAGLVGTLAGAQALVSGASGVARGLGVSEAVIGLTVVAVGTSLPELVTAVAAARRGEADLVIGNVLGSNLFNSLPIAGVAGLVGAAEPGAAFGVSVVTMGLLAAFVTVFLVTGRRLARGEGALLLLVFAGYLGWTVLG